MQLYINLVCQKTARYTVSGIVSPNSGDIIYEAFLPWTTNVRRILLTDPHTNTPWVVHVVIIVRGSLGIIGGSFMLKRLRLGCIGHLFIYVSFRRVRVYSIKQVIEYNLNRNILLLCVLQKRRSEPEMTIYNFILMHIIEDPQCTCRTSIITLCIPPSVGGMNHIFIQGSFTRVPVFIALNWSLYITCREIFFLCVL